MLDIIYVRSFLYGIVKIDTDISRITIKNLIFIDSVCTDNKGRTIASLDKQLGVSRLLLRK